MRTATTAALTAVTCLALAGCGGGGGDEAAAGAPSSSSAPSSSATSSAPAPAASPTTGVSYGLSTQICATGMSAPDSLVRDAMDAARAGTRSVSEIAGAFQAAQDAVEALRAQASADYPHLTQSLGAYADVLGRARVTGDVGLPEITDARAAVNTACYTPDAPA